MRRSVLLEYALRTASRQNGKEVQELFLIVGHGFRQPLLDLRDTGLVARVG